MGGVEVFRSMGGVEVFRSEGNGLCSNIHDLWSGVVGWERGRVGGRQYMQMYTHMHTCMSYTQTCKPW